MADKDVVHDFSECPELVKKRLHREGAREKARREHSLQMLKLSHPKLKPKMQRAIESAYSMGRMDQLTDDAERACSRQIRKLARQYKSKQRKGWLSRLNPFKTK